MTIINIRSDTDLKNAKNVIKFEFRGHGLCISLKRKLWTQSSLRKLDTFLEQEMIVIFVGKKHHTYLNSNQPSNTAPKNKAKTNTYAFKKMNARIRLFWLDLSCIELVGAWDFKYTRHP